MQNNMKTSILGIAVLAAATVAIANQAQMNPMVGGNAMMSNKNIVANAMNSKDHTTLVAAVKAAGLVEACIRSRFAAPCRQAQGHPAAARYPAAHGGGAAEDPA